MSDQYDPARDTSGLASLTTSDFAQFMIERGVITHCLFCQGEIRIAENMQGQTFPTAISASIPPTTDSMVFHYEFRTKCINCGNIQSYDRGEVLRWKIGRAR